MATLFEPSVERLTDALGVPISGGKLAFYLTNTTTLATVYTDATGTVPISNPVVANSVGMFPTVFLDESTVYRARWTDASGIQLRPDADPVYGSNPSVTAAVAAATAAGAAQVALAATQVGLATVAAANSASARDSAVVAAATVGVFPNTAGVGGFIPKGAIAVTTVAGSGGTNATGKLALSTGGTLTYNPVISYDVVGGVVTNVVMRFPGLYIGTGTPTMPTLTLPGIGAGTGTITLTAGVLYGVGQTYWAASADGQTLDNIINTAGSPASNSANVPSVSTSSQKPPNGTMQRALTLVTAAGTTYSATVQSALRQFEYQLRQMQLNSFFVRLNPFLGTGSAGPRIPFIQRAGVGFSSDTGTIGSWTEGSGLVNATLDTGVTLSAAGQDIYNTLLGCYNLVDPNNAGGGYVVGDQSGQWGLNPDTTGDPTTTSAGLFSWDFAGRVIGQTYRQTTGAVSGGSLTKGPMSAYRRSDGSNGITLCGYPLLITAAGLPSSTIAEPTTNIKVQAITTWPIGGYWIADPMSDAALIAFHKIYHDLQVAVGRGVVTEGY